MNPTQTLQTGAVIRAARRSRQVSLRKLAASVNVSPATLSAIENGKTGVSVVRLHAIAAALQTTADRLLRGIAPDDEPAPVEMPSARAPFTAYSVEQETKAWRRYAPLNVDPMLQAAITAFMETGYHGATMRAIASRAGISVPGLYHHYPSKQDLLVRILDMTMAELLWRVPAARDEACDTRQRVAFIVECLALFHTHRRELAFLGASEMRSLEPANQRRIAALRTAIQRMMDTEIAAGVANGQFRTPAPHEAGRAISTMCTSLPQWFRAAGPLTPEAIAKEYADFALGMLKHV